MHRPQLNKPLILLIAIVFLLLGTIEANAALINYCESLFENSRTTLFRADSSTRESMSPAVFNHRYFTAARAGFYVRGVARALQFPFGPAKDALIEVRFCFSRIEESSYILESDISALIQSLSPSVLANAGPVYRPVFIETIDGLAKVAANGGDPALRKLIINRFLEYKRDPKTSSLALGGVYDRAILYSAQKAH